LRRGKDGCGFDRDCERPGREFVICARDELNGRTPLYRGELARIDKRIMLSCPYFLIHRSAAVSSVAEMYEWREVGGLNWADVPVFARRAVTAFARGVSRRRAHDLEEDRKRSERDSADRGGRQLRCNTR
jgi:hypothetical protein